MYDSRFGDSSLKMDILFTQDFFQIFIPDDPKEIQVESQNLVRPDFWCCWLSKCDTVSHFTVYPTIFISFVRNVRSNAITGIIMLSEVWHYFFWMSCDFEEKIRLHLSRLNFRWIWLNVNKFSDLKLIYSLFQYKKYVFAN